MGIFKKNKAKIAANMLTDDTGYVCATCGRFNPMEFNFCPICGTKRFSTSNNDYQIPKYNPIDENKTVFPTDETVEYLRKMNLQHLADKQYEISVQLPNGYRVMVPLIGKQNSNDALKYLCSIGLLSNEETYRFTNWPTANPCIGPWFHNISAFVCELSLDTIYCIETLKMEDIKCLYGCPNPKSIIKSTVLDNVKVEIIDYEK